MKKEMILDDNERQKRLLKVARNREKRKRLGEGADHCVSPTPAAITHQFDSSSHSSSPFPVEDVQVCGTPNNNKAPTLSVNPSITPVLDASVETRQLTDEELILITSLQNVYMGTLGDESDPPPESSLTNLVNATGTIVRKLIKFSKKLEDFMNLTQDLQIVLLKGATLNCIFLRSAVSYDIDKDAWISPRGEISTTILKSATGHVMKQLHEDHVMMCRKMKELTGNDLTLFIILQVMILFSPEYVHINQRALVSNIQDRYCILLKHYMESTYSFRAAQDMFPAILQRLSEMKKYSEEHGKILLHVNPREIEPMLLEVFDIKGF